ncbi:2-dehydropantoate 2-reductase [Neobacillus sp. CF12]|uniref:2-dehydropantoate 2-reductase n=1 Tax=Neobacillus sp. CF12 TaxID=3055864 RepID=UPI0025A03078|nr:2-dehydropantoate 2-reductase [Neobacillus sp. CF12]MDM5328047.1 2-dehydropantoate 2-reductase [Neobacillus sp. CF12]
MNIAIIGAGSIGLLLASYLSKAFSITLYTRTCEQADEINQQGILLHKGSSQSRVRVRALPLSKWSGTEEITIIAVKQYQLQSIIDYLTKLDCSPQNLVFLQNGMSHLKLLENMKDANIFVGTVEQGASKLNKYSVCHNGEGAINIALFKGDSAKIKEFAKACTPIGFPITIKDDYYKMLVNKLIVNAVINPLTAILQIKNGQLISSTFYFATVKKLYIEISFILNVDEPIKKFRDVIRICKKTSNNHSSMLKDLEAGRRTEIDAILGFLVEEAAKQQKKAPIIESYYYLVKGKEQDRSGVK